MFKDQTISKFMEMPYKLCLKNVSDFMNYVGN